MLSEKCHYAESRFSESRGAIAIFQVEKKNCFVQFFFRQQQQHQNSSNNRSKKGLLEARTVS